MTRDALAPARIHTSSPEETREWGRRLGASLRAGDVIALSGDLGAGKTVLAHGIAAGAQATGYVASPTFTLIRQYAGPTPVHHVDLFRIEQARQIDDLGLEEILGANGIVVIEWAEKAKAWLPAEHLWIEIRLADDDDRRELCVVPHGARFARVLEQLAASPSPPSGSRRHA